MRWVVLMAVLFTAVIPAPAIAAGPIGGGARPARRRVATCPGSRTHRATSRPWPRSPGGTRACASSSCSPRRGSPRRPAPRSSPLVGATGCGDARPTRSPPVSDRRAPECSPTAVRATTPRRPVCSRSARSPLGTARRSPCSATTPTPGVRSNVTYRVGAQRGLLGRDARRVELQPPASTLPNCPGPDDEWLPRIRRRVLPRRGDRRQPRSGVGRRVRRDTVRRGDLPPSQLVHGRPANRSRRAAACRSPTSTSSRSSASSTRRSPRSSPSARPATSCRTWNNLRTRAAD